MLPSPLLDPVLISVNHHLPGAAETFPHISKAMVYILKSKPCFLSHREKALFVEAFQSFVSHVFKVP